MREASRYLLPPGVAAPLCCPAVRTHTRRRRRIFTAHVHTWTHLRGSEEHNLLHSRTLPGKASKRIQRVPIRGRPGGNSRRHDAQSAVSWEALRQESPTSHTKGPTSHLCVYISQNN